MAAVQAALDKKAEKLELLDLRDGLAFTDFFIICTGNNIRQVQAIADGIQEALRDHGVRPALVEGYQRAEWILLDYFDFIVHVFTPGTRDFYALDRLWGDARRIEVPAT
ncbi:MAG: ribosome silencing factor [Acidobacteria bacterium]|nr:MAG: ribosome silencing factor [Acidobacteriota bacterium]